MREGKHINEAVELLLSKSANGIVSVVEVDHPVEWTNTLAADQSMTNFLLEEVREKRSQEFPVRYRVNGAIYINKIENFLSSRSLFLKQKAYIIPKIASVDIDYNLI